MKPMRYFAAHRVWIWNRNEMLGICRVGVDDETRCVKSVEPFDGEVERTEWLGGLIAVAPGCPPRFEGEPFARYKARALSEWSSVEADSSPLYAYHFSSFDVSAMEFHPSARIVRL